MICGSFILICGIQADPHGMRRATGASLFVFLSLRVCKSTLTFEDGISKFPAKDGEWVWSDVTIDVEGLE